MHDPALLGHLASVWEDWEAAGLPAEYGRDRVVPYVFPTPGLLAGLPLRIPPAVHGRAGLYCYDTMTLVGPGSWAAIRGAADAAQTAADLVSGGTPVAYALCRPPGHHATRSAYGGSCYLNNAAVAAEALRAAGAARVAVLDIDAHHGNGTQMIFWERADVWYGSLHVDPGRGLVPALRRLRGERGAGPGAGFTRNLPLAPGTGDDGWLAALDALCGGGRLRSARRPWWCRWAWTRRRPTRKARCGSPRPPTGLRAGGSPRWAPAVLVQEGGYRPLPALGALAVAAHGGCRLGCVCAARGTGGLRPDPATGNDRQRYARARTSAAAVPPRHTHPARTGTGSGTCIPTAG